MIRIIIIATRVEGNTIQFFLLSWSFLPWKDCQWQVCNYGGLRAPDPCPFSQKGGLFLGTIRNFRLDMKCTVNGIYTTREGEIQINHGWDATVDSLMLFPSHQTVYQTPSLRVAYRDIFPSIRKLLVIGCISPIISCEAERVASGVRRLKTAYRSTMASVRESDLNLNSTNVAWLAVKTHCCCRCLHRTAAQENVFTTYFIWMTLCGRSALNSSWSWNGDETVYCIFVWFSATNYHH